MTGAVERYTPAYVERVAEDWIASSFLPASYLDTQGHPKKADVILACSYLAALDCDPRAWFRGTYVIGARVELMAEPQRALLARHGYDLSFVEDSAERVTGRIRRRGDHWQEPVTVTLAEAQQKGWADRNRHNYNTQPDAMLRARVTTRLVSLYAPEVKYEMADVDRRFGLRGPADDGDDGDDDSGERSYERPAGYHTVVRTERSVPAEQVVHLEARVAGLAPGRADQLRALWRSLDGPNLRGPNFTPRDAILLGYLIDDTTTIPAGPTAPTGWDTGRPAAGGEGAPTTSTSRNERDDVPPSPPAPYDPDDPERPFDD